MAQSAMLLILASKFMSLSDDPDFANVDEALPGEVPRPFVAVTRPVQPDDEEQLEFSDVDEPPNVTAHFPEAPREDIVEKLYLKKQLRDNAVTFMRKEMEYMKMRDCTFQPNAHLHRPDGDASKFLMMQRVYEQRRKARLEKLMKEREAAQVLEEQTSLSFRPELSPASVRLAQKDKRPVVERLLTPKRTVELIPEVSFAYHPLISPRAHDLRREKVYELLSRQRKPQKESPAPKPPAYVDAQSQALLVSQFRKDFQQAAAELPQVISLEQYTHILITLQAATDRDKNLIDESWRMLPGRSEEGIDKDQLAIVLEDLVVRHAGTADKKLQKVFIAMRRSRLASPGKFHTHEETLKFVPTIDSASREMVSRDDFLSWQEQYQEALTRKRELRARRDQKLFAEQCSFSPKVHRQSPPAHPVLKKLRSGPSETQLTEGSPRYEMLHLYGQQMREERRLLSPPDREFEVNKEELTFAPRRMTSYSPRRHQDGYPTDYERTVKRLKDAFKQHEELQKHFIRGVPEQKPQKPAHSTAAINESS